MLLQAEVIFLASKNNIVCPDFRWFPVHFYKAFNTLINGADRDVRSARYLYCYFFFFTFPFVGGLLAVPIVKLKSAAQLGVVSRMVGAMVAY